MTRRQSALKTVLWFFVGVLAIVSLARFLKGLGATTALTDAAPWGLWIAFDVMSGVALAAGGFVIAGTVYILGLKRFQVLARPAILTAFLGYAAVTVGLLYDLGIPLHIWHPVVYPQPHSVLFEVGMCVMFYLTVLFLEFCPVILEHPFFDRPFFRTIHHNLKKVSIPLVIAGIVLSTLHQSSLGSLFLITPYRVHPLWYSPIIWILFLVSAVGLGLMVVTAESLFSSWYFGHRIRLNLLGSLGKAAAVVLSLYLVLRFSDMAWRGILPLALDGSWQAAVFLLEISLVVAAIAMLSVGRVRNHPGAMAVASLFSILAMIGYRFNVSIVAFQRPEGMSYFPSWIEVVVTVGIVSGAMLVFIFFAQHLRVFPPQEEGATAPAIVCLPEPGPNPMITQSLLPGSIAAVRRYSLAATVGAALAFALLSDAVRTGAQLTTTPVLPPLQMAGGEESLPNGITIPVGSIPPDSGGDQPRRFILDGNRNGRLVVFDHGSHAKRLGGDTSCGGCHHLNLPFRWNTACHDCHRDMYLPTDLFAHSLHVGKLEGNRSCTRCHPLSNPVKSEQTSEPCTTCHKADRGYGSVKLVKRAEMAPEAPGYATAMHKLCEDCHQRLGRERPQDYRLNFGECATCHQNTDRSYLQKLSPYASMAAEF